MDGTAARAERTHTAVGRGGGKVCSPHRVSTPPDSRSHRWALRGVGQPPLRVGLPQGPAPRRGHMRVCVFVLARHTCIRCHVTSTNTCIRCHVTSTNTCIRCHVTSTNTCIRCHVTSTNMTPVVKLNGQPALFHQVRGERQRHTDADRRFFQVRPRTHYTHSVIPTPIDASFRSASPLESTASEEREGGQGWVE